jgi:hypothetical protein
VPSSRTDGARGQIPFQSRTSRRNLRKDAAYVAVTLAMLSGGMVNQVEAMYPEQA